MSTAADSLVPPASMLPSGCLLHRLCDDAAYVVAFRRPCQRVRTPRSFNSAFIGTRYCFTSCLSTSRVLPSHVHALGSCFCLLVREASHGDMFHLISSYIHSISHLHLHSMCYRRVQDFKRLSGRTMCKAHKTNKTHVTCENTRPTV